MTTEEKAKRYDEALERAKAMIKVAANQDEAIGFANTIFPELKESENERIRKTLICGMYALKEQHKTCFASIPIDNAIAWLEKQGKQEQGSEFKADDWYVSKVDGKIHNIKYGLKKQGEQKGYTFKSIPRLLDMIEPSDKAKAYCQKLIDTLVKEGYNTDAKIVEEVLKGWNGEDVPMAVMDEQKPVFEIKTPEESLGIDSATYNKIVDECIYGEQKPTDKIEPFDKYEGLTDFERTLADICIGWIGEEPGWKQYIKDNADILLKIAVEKFNSVQDTPFEQKPTDEEMKTLLRTEYEKGRADVISEFQKAWSEEDESYLNTTIAYLKDAKEFKKSAENCINWLKSLKDRVQPRRRHTIFDEII